MKRRKGYLNKKTDGGKMNKKNKKIKLNRKTVAVRQRTYFKAYLFLLFFNVFLLS